MVRVRCITEMGMGVDVHGRDATKAAKRAVSDAIRHSSLGFFRMVGKTSKDMFVDVTIAVPNPEAVDTAAVAEGIAVWNGDGHRGQRRARNSGRAGQRLHRHRQRRRYREPRGRQGRRMTSDLSTFPITRRWPAAHPDRLQLYSLPTPNGVKVSIMLEEIGLPYEVHLVDFNKDDQKTPEFLSLNPNGKIPAILDPDGPGGQALGLFESGAILQYLAEKTGKLLPMDSARRYETLQWLHFQMGGIGPMFGQLGFFHKFAGKEISDKRPLERYVAESKASAWRDGNPARRQAVDHGRRNTPSRTFQCWAGCVI